MFSELANMSIRDNQIDCPQILVSLMMMSTDGIAEHYQLAISQLMRNDTHLLGHGHE